MWRATYPIELRSAQEDGGGGWTASVPEFPQCFGTGRTPQEAVRDIEHRFRQWSGTPVFRFDRSLAELSRRA